MTSLLQVFYWGTAAGFSGGRQYYDSFSLNGCDYQVGDAVSLFPEDDAQPHFLARLESAYIDSAASDPHVITVSWYERRDNQEVVELGETDVNPIGCISGKVQVFHCSSSVEAQKLARCVDQEWFFCRSSGKDLSKGMARHTAHQLDDADYSEDEAVEHSRYVKQEAGPKRQRHNSGGAGMVLESLQREELEGYTRGRNPPSYRPAPAKAAPGVLLGGRTCVQCNATQTPQWREGPAGPKTLCNACGVRYCRLQQRDSKKPHGVGAARRGGSMASPASKPGRIGKGRKETWKGGAARDPMEYAADPYAVDVPTTRPVRQAALLSATRTAEYARTGVFPSSSSMQEHDDNSYQNEGRYHAEAQGGEGGADWGEKEDGVDMEEDPEGDEELEVQGTGDSCTATAAGVRISSGSEPTSPNGSSLHTHTAEHGSIALSAMQQRVVSASGSGLALAGRGLGSRAGQHHQHATDSHTHPKQTAGLPSSTRGSGSGDSPDSAFDSIDAMLLLAAGGRNAAADAALLESGTGSPLTACELQELMLLAALGGPLGDVSCAPSPMSACMAGLGGRAGQSGMESNESSQQQDAGFVTLPNTQASEEELLAGSAAPGGHVTEEDVRFSLSIRAEDFCPEFDVETYQSAFAPYDNLKESLQEDALEKLHGAGDSSQKPVAQPSGLLQMNLAVPLGDINPTTSSLVAVLSQPTPAIGVLPAPTPTSLNTTCLTTAINDCSTAGGLDDCSGLDALLAAATEVSKANVLEEQIPQIDEKVAGSLTAQAVDVCPP